MHARSLYILSANDGAILVEFCQKPSIWKLTCCFGACGRKAMTPGQRTYHDMLHASLQCWVLCVFLHVLCVSVPSLPAKIQMCASLCKNCAQSALTRRAPVLAITNSKEYRPKFLPLPYKRRLQNISAKLFWNRIGPTKADGGQKPAYVLALCLSRHLEDAIGEKNPRSRKTARRTPLP